MAQRYRHRVSCFLGSSGDATEGSRGCLFNQDTNLRNSEGLSHSCRSGVLPMSDDAMTPLNELVGRARQGDVPAFGQVVAATQAMACAVALGVLRDSAQAQDAAQEAYLRAFRR